MKAFTIQQHRIRNYCSNLRYFTGLGYLLPFRRPAQVRRTVGWRLEATLDQGLFVRYLPHVFLCEIECILRRRPFHPCQNVHIHCACGRTRLRRLVLKPAGRGNRQAPAWLVWIRIIPNTRLRHMVVGELLEHATLLRFALVVGFSRLIVGWELHRRYCRFFQGRVWRR